MTGLFSITYLIIYELTRFRLITHYSVHLYLGILVIQRNDQATDSIYHFLSLTIYQVKTLKEIQNSGLLATVKIFIFSKS